MTFKIAIQGTRIQAAAAAAGLFAVTLAALAIPSSAATWSGVDGTQPSGSILANGQELYGTTATGGVYNAGTVYQVNANGTGYEVLYEFTGGADGANPCDMTFGHDGNLYIVTQRGGVDNEGVLDKLTTSGTETTLESFSYGVGAYPICITEDSNNNFYGVAYHGGDSGSDGTLWEYSSTGVFSSLHNFDSATDGANPDGPLTLDGTTLYGTTPDGGNGYGSVFSYSVSTGTYTTMDLFGADGDGCYPYGKLLKYNGLLYGTTTRGIGPRYGGNIFTISETYPYPETSLVSMGNPTVFPHVGLVVDANNPTNGILYGTTEGDDTYNCGSIYSFTVSGDTLGAIATFPAPLGSLGEDPGPLTQVNPPTGPSAFYFVTPNGGPTNSGVLYSVPVTTNQNQTVTFIHNFNTITLDSSNGNTNGYGEPVVVQNVTTTRPNDLLVANMVGYTSSAFTGPSPVTINGASYPWIRVTPGSTAQYIRQEIWDVRLPVAVTNLSLTFSFNGTSSSEDVVVDAYAGTDPNNPVGNAGLDKIGTTVVDDSTSFPLTYTFSGASVTPVNKYSTIAQYTGLFWINPISITAGSPFVITNLQTHQVAAHAPVWVDDFGMWDSTPQTIDGSPVSPAFTIVSSGQAADNIIATALSLRLPNSAP